MQPVFVPHQVHRRQSSEGQGGTGSPPLMAWLLRALLPEFPCLRSCKCPGQWPQLLCGLLRGKKVSGWEKAGASKLFCFPHLPYFFFFLTPHLPSSAFTLLFPPLPSSSVLFPSHLLVYMCAHLCVFSSMFFGGMVCVWRGRGRGDVKRNFPSALTALTTWRCLGVKGFLNKIFKNVCDCNKMKCRVHYFLL